MSILDSAGELKTAAGPRELEQATAELVGAELHGMVHDDAGVHVELWFRSLAADAAIRLLEGKAGEGVRYLLHGLTAIGPPGTVPATRQKLQQTKRVAGAEPAWLQRMAKPKAGREAWRLEDRFGTRLAIVMEYAFAKEPSVAYLFDVDACGLPRLAGAGVHDDVEAAAEAWRSAVGDTAAGAPLERVTSSSELRALAQLDFRTPMGDETRNQADEWFRAERRIHDLATALRSTACPVPARRSFFDEDSTPLVEEFTEWHTGAHGGPPDPELTEMVAQEWQDGILPQTTYCVSPERLAYQLAIIDDSYERETAAELRALLCRWSRWLGERDGLPEDLLDRVDRAARAPFGAAG